ncbi:efflux RND transporter permease subunit [Ferribacterium limneticum]|uniref:efflux RND transporter permease subunit n=1 Tax=Ferribacterium limneticum TaxID=76259 RepID=UPI001CF994D2|nr:MMPL family transporter [Ferribacterium limneticum]UCV17778.1 MMPL family transporter [Ferribacterium limneticum]
MIIKKSDMLQSLVERAIFGRRPIIIILCLLVTIGLIFEAASLRVNAGFDKMIPQGHEFIKNYMANKAEITSSSNNLRIVVETTAESIFEPKYVETLRRINDEVFLLPGVERSYFKSLWMPSVRWVGVTEEGIESGPVMPESYNGSTESIDELRTNVMRSGEVGQLVGLDLKSTTILAPLIDRNEHGERLDYQRLSTALEAVRVKYESNDVKIHIVGFGKLVGDLIDALHTVALFFALAIVVCMAVLYWHTRCIRSTLLVVSCSLLAVVWLLGLLPLLGFELDPYSVLVPFLIFAIGMSHGAQKMNGIMQDIGRGEDKLVAARLTFRRLFLAGVTALLADVVGFAVLMIIDIKVIQELAIAASLGVGVLIFTNLILLPILLSYVGVSPEAAQRSLKEERSALGNDGASSQKLWTLLTQFTTRRWATAAICVFVVIGALSYYYGRGVKVGDLEPGAPELRAESQYNRDNAYITSHYAASSDVFMVMVKTQASECNTYRVLSVVDKLELELQQIPQVESIKSFAGFAKMAAVGMNEGSFLWYDLPRNQGMLNSAANRGVPRELINQRCDMASVIVYLKDHKSETLDQVVATTQSFADRYSSEDIQILMAAGNAGIEAATNSVVRHADHMILWLVYLAVSLLAYVTFRSIRAVICAVLPLVVTTLMSQALMVSLDIGIKVATLPVIALGVGIGVDYSLYVLSVVMAELRSGASLKRAYYAALAFTGRVVVLTGLTLAVAVLMWVASPIKFQADMGALLAFMFGWNMVASLILIPALGHFLLQPQATADGSSYSSMVLEAHPEPVSTQHTKLPCLKS